MNEVVQDLVIEGFDVLDNENDRDLRASWAQIEKLLDSVKCLFLQNIAELRLV